MPERGLDLQAIAKLIHLVETRGLEELQVEEGAVRVTVRRGPPTDAPQLAAAVPTAQQPAGPAPETRQRTIIAAPMVGVFYRASAPDERAFVEVGDHVEVGQTIGIIEAMKVFSEIPSDHAGRCVEVVARSGQLVQAGEPLLYLADED